MENIEMNENQLNIFTILLSNDNEGKDHLDKIAEIGGTIKAYKENNFKGLDNTFRYIANSINPSFGLKMK